MQDRTDREIMEYHGWTAGGQSRVVKSAPREAGSNAKLTIDERLAIIGDYNAGMKVPALAIKHRVTEKTVRETLSKANVYDPSRDRGKRESSRS